MKAARYLGPLSLIVLVTSLFPATVASAQAEVNLSGTWEWSNDSNQTSVYSGPVAIEHDVTAATFTWEADVSGPDSSSFVTGNGTVEGAFFQITTDVYSDPSGATYTAHYDGQIVDAATLQGTWTQSDGQDGTFIATKQSSTYPQCSDEVDNDGDGQTDYPNDLQCTSSADVTETIPQCEDDADNDGDGRTDYPGDTGCVDPLDDTENSERRFRVSISATPALVELDDDVLIRVRIVNVGPAVVSDAELRIGLKGRLFAPPVMGELQGFSAGCSSRQSVVYRDTLCMADPLAPGEEASVSFLSKAVRVDLGGSPVYAVIPVVDGLGNVGIAEVTVHIRPSCGATYDGAKVKCGSGSITGTDKPDILVGSGKADTLKGGGGDDWLFGLLNNDNLFGGPGADRLIGGPSNDTFDGGKGRDHCEGDKGEEVGCEEVM